MTRDLSKATTFKDKVRPASAVSRWSMDNSDLDSETIRDSWGSNDGTLNGEVTTGVSGIGGGEAFSFDGEDDYVNVSNFLGNIFTISAWVTNGNNGSLSGEESIIQTYDSYDNAINGMRFEYTTSDTLRIEYGDGSDSVSVESSQISSGEWKHHVAVVDANNGIIYLYVDGVLIASNDSALVTTITHGPNINIGREPNSGSEFWKGNMDEVRIYDSALSQQQIWKLYNIGRNANWGFTRS